MRDLTSKIRWGPLAAAAGLTMAAAPAGAQLNITWWTIDCGGLTSPSTGGSFAVSGTIGQPDAGRLSGPNFVVLGGFWSVTAPQPCYANCDASTIPPILNVSDFVCFQAKFAAGDPYANCDESTVPPVLNVSDFVCFQGKFAAGCP
jgi:hypothetical protein